MGRVRRHFDRAVAAYLSARAHVAGTRGRLDDLAAADQHAAEEHLAAQRELAQALGDAAESMTPGWWGTPLQQPPTDVPPLGTQPPTGAPMMLHIGVAWLSKEDWFPVAVPVLGGGHLTVDANLRDAKAASLMRAVLLRLLASCPPERLEIRLVDGASAGAAFAVFQPLVEAGALVAPVIDASGLSGVLDEAEEHVRRAQAAAAEGRLAEVPYLVVMGGLPEARGEYARLAALAHAGPSARLHLVLAGWPPAQPYGQPSPPLDHAVRIELEGTWARVYDPPGEHWFSAHGRALAARVSLDDDPNPLIVDALCQALAGQAKASAAFTFADLVPEKLWPESSLAGLRTVVGRDGRIPVELAFDDATPHWMIGGRSGSGKTVFQLNLLYGLAARYSPDELALYLLDFKEGVSFTEFSPTDLDPSWIPHARAVGIESDREYGLAVLRELQAEMGRRSQAMKRAGVTKLADLRTARPDVPVPRIVCVIDEFHVLFQGTSRLARQAVALLEDLARKGRSYGIHLVLASQTISGVEALYNKKDSIFGQFPLRIALAGGGGVLDQGNAAADGLPIGSAIVNEGGGLAERNRLIRFPDAHAAGTAVTDLRSRLWEARPKGNRPPAVFAGYAEQHIEDDPTFATGKPDSRRRWLMVGRTVDVGLSTAAFPLDATPGRHLAVLGPSAVGADILHAAVAGLARQHEPGSVRFVLVPLVAAADDVVAETMMALEGHQVEERRAPQVRATLAELAGDATNTYLVVFGADAAGPLLADKDERKRSGLDDLRTVLKTGPARGVHLLGWWRGVKRFAEDVGGGSGREDVACLVALNVAANDLGSLVGDHSLDWQPRPNRALLLDRHEQRTALIVPFVRPGRHDEDGALW